MRSHLVPCPMCSRHVRVSEALCVHCGSALPERIRSLSEPAAPGRLGRGALYAVGVAVGVGSLALFDACASSDGSEISAARDASTTADGSDDRVNAAYGCPPPYCGPSDEDAGDAATDDASDAGVGDAEGASDAALDAADSGTGIAPPYGHPPTDSGM